MECPNCKSGDAEQYESDGKEIIECPDCGTFELQPDGGVTPYKMPAELSSEPEPEPTPEPSPEPSPEPNENATAALQEAASRQQGSADVALSQPAPVDSEPEPEPSDEASLEIIFEDDEE